MSRASHDWFDHNDDHARSSDGPLHHSRRVGAAISHGINTWHTCLDACLCQGCACKHLDGSDAIMGTSSRVVANRWPSVMGARLTKPASPLGKGGEHARVP